MKDPDVDEGGKDSEHEETGMLEMSVSEYSIEGLRREVRKGARGIPSDYERMLTRGRAPSCRPKFETFSASILDVDDILLQSVPRL